MRWLSKALGAAALGLLSAADALGGITINEVRIDQTGTDNDEYFELTGTPGESLDGLTYIVIGDGAAAAGSGVIEAVVSLAGLSIPADGYFLCTESTFTLRAIATVDLVLAGNGLNFENTDNVTHLLVRNFTGASAQDLDTNDDGTLDSTPWTAIVDSVALTLAAAGGSELVYSPTVIADGSEPGHAYRLPNATGTWRFGPFNPAAPTGEDTPGVENVAPAPPPPPPATDRTIPEIQGAAHVSPHAGTRVRTTGIVTVVVGNGFYLQDPAGDGNVATSEGIFVFTGSAPGVAAGDSLKVEGTVQEFIPGGPSTNNLSTTEIGGSPIRTTLSTGNALPAPLVIGPSPGRLPPATVIDDDGLAVFDPASDGIDFYESLEGMLLLIPNPVVIGPTNVFGEIWVLAADGAGTTGRNTRGGITLTETDYNPERIQIQIGDEGILPGFDPQVSVGDHLGDVTGVMDYDFGQFQVLASRTFAVTAGTLARETTVLDSTCDALTIAGFNTHNLDPNDLDADTDVADGLFERLAEQIVDALGSPDILALQEIQDDTGAANDGTTGSDLTLTMLVDAIADAGGPEYEFAYLPPVNNQDGGEPGGNIRVAYLYDPARVTLVPGSLQRIVDTNLGDGDAFESSRKPLMAEFVFNTRHVTVIDVHFTSKGGSTPLFGKVQPPVNGGVAQRTAQATIVRGVVDGLHASDPQAKVVVIGDFNEFDFNQPLVVLEGSGATALTNLTTAQTILERYSYVFEGSSQSLDHVLLSQALVPVATHDIVHVNAEFADQASDHDPQVVRLKLPHPTAAEVLAFFDAAVQSGALLGTSTKDWIAEHQLDSVRDDLCDAASKERRGQDSAAAARLRSALDRVDGDPSPPDTIAGTAKAELAARIASAIEGLSCDRDAVCKKCKGDRRCRDRNKGHRWSRRGWGGWDR